MFKFPHATNFLGVTTFKVSVVLWLFVSLWVALDESCGFYTCFFDTKFLETTLYNVVIIPLMIYLKPFICSYREKTFHRILSSREPEESSLMLLFQELVIFK